MMMMMMITSQLRSRGDDLRWRHTKQLSELAAHKSCCCPVMNSFIAVTCDVVHLSLYVAVVGGCCGATATQYEFCRCIVASPTAVGALEAAATARRRCAADTGTTTRLSPATRSRRRTARKTSTPSDVTQTAAPAHSNDAIITSSSSSSAAAAAPAMSIVTLSLHDVTKVVDLSSSDVTCSLELASSCKLALLVFAETVAAVDVICDLLLVRFGLVVTSLGASTKLLYVQPG